MMNHPIEKVTVFITRPATTRLELLLFDHPYAGVQIPAGTVNPGETPEEAAHREAAEETGLKGLSLIKHLGVEKDILPASEGITGADARVYAHPNEHSLSWAYIRRGIRVHRTGRSFDGYTQVAYEEPDQLPDPNFISMAITGWVHAFDLRDTIHRHFFHLACSEPTPNHWMRSADSHQIRLFWAPIAGLPKIIHPQYTWLPHLLNSLPNS